METRPRRSRTISQYGVVSGSPRPSKISFDEQSTPRSTTVSPKDLVPAFDLANDSDGLFVPALSLDDEDEQMEEDYTKASTTAMTSNAYYPEFNMKGYFEDINKIDSLVRPLQKPEEELKCTLIGEQFGCITDLTLEQLIITLKYKVKTLGLKRVNQLKPFWVDFTSIGPTDMDVVEETFGLHPLTGYDCVASEIREKWESFHSYLFLVIHEIAPDSKASWLHLVPLRIALFQSFILTFHSLPLTSVNETISLLAGNKYQLRSPDWCMFCILKNLVNIFEKRVASIALEVQTLDELILVLSSSEEDCDDLLGRIRNANSQLSSLYWMMSIKQEILLSVCSRQRLHITRITQLFLRSLLDTVIKMRFDLLVSSMRSISAIPSSNDNFPTLIDSTS
eukprot:TRINITY_DN9077_c0_g1_i2.p1 TRINITY_DN9077_c0_g1~~TRINITY_DN9077_c0_g1_i2.p1  ORF type:complete len:394 (+),score=66.04 TRINITY_DN9077_c0_g1_i2:179-1360(+)